jgi:hypothetical protein
MPVLFVISWRGAADVLKTLYGRVLVPEAVVAQLQDAKTPATVRAWISTGSGLV